MAWELLPVNYTDAVWSGLKKYVTVTNEDDTVSFRDVTAYSNKDTSFFGAKDANKMNEALNRLMSMVENGTDLYEAFTEYFHLQKSLFEGNADTRYSEFSTHLSKLEAEGYDIITALDTESTAYVRNLEDKTNSIINTLEQESTDYLTEVQTEAYNIVSKLEKESTDTLDTLKTASDDIVTTLEDNAKAYLNDLQTEGYEYVSNLKKDATSYMDDLKTEGDNFISNMKSEYEDEINTFENQQEAVFNMWFSFVRDKLNDDIAGNLQLQIDDLTTKADGFDESNIIFSDGGKVITEITGEKKIVTEFVSDVLITQKLYLKNNEGEFILAKTKSIKFSADGNTITQEVI